MNDLNRGGRRRFLGRIAASVGALGVAGCDRLSQTEWFPKVLGSAEALNGHVAKLVTGRKAMAQEYTPAELRALPSRTQITRHDCVEGWSAIGKWQGAKLSAILDDLRPTTAARYVVFHCADPMEQDGTSPYYESIDMDD